MTTGFYSLIQYCPDLSRLESANLGVVLYCPEMGFLDLKLSSNTKRVRKFFGREAGNASQLQAMLSSIRARLLAERERIKCLADLEHFAAIQGNSIQLTPARRVLVDKPLAELNRLFNLMVGGETRRREKADVVTLLAKEFATPKYIPLIRRKVQVVVPFIRRAITIPYGYQNGRFNLVQPASFLGDAPSDLLQKVGGLAVEGEELFHNPSNQYGELQLIVVGQFPRDGSAIVEDVRRRFAKHKTRLYRLEEAHQLFEEIRAHAKPIPGSVTSDAFREATEEEPVS
jgi:hypothetical protein